VGGVDKRAARSRVTGTTTSVRSGACSHGAGPGRARLRRVRELGRSDRAVQPVRAVQGAVSDGRTAQERLGQLKLVADTRSREPYVQRAPNGPRLC